MYWCLIYLFDAIDYLYNCVFRVEKRARKLQRPSISDEFSLDEILSLSETKPDVSDQKRIRILRRPITRICEDTVVKKVYLTPSFPHECSEALAMQLVRSKTSICVPEIRRVIHHDYNAYILMEHIDGQPLDKCWPHMSLFEKIRIACILRSYLKQLRALVSEMPGPPGPRPLECLGIQFNELTNPFPNHSAISDYFLTSSMGSTLGPLFKSKRLVFTHNDINLSNILVGADGKVWLLDWEFAGFFPEWFDPVIMWFQAVTRHEKVDTIWLWRRFIPFIFNPAFEQWDLGVRVVGFSSMKM